MKHINIQNWQGKITDHTKFNYIYGGLDEIIADRVNLRIPGTNSRNYIEQNQYGWLILTENVGKDENNNVVVLPTPKTTVFRQIDLGTLPWKYMGLGDPSYFYAALSAKESINVSCPLYKSAMVSQTNSEDKIICIAENKKLAETEVRIRDNALQGSIIDLKAKLKGVIFYFETKSQ